MGAFIVLIVIVALACYISKEKRKGQQQEEQKKLNADISRVESSAFYKQISQFIQETISDYEREIRREVREKYSIYLKKNSSQPFDCFVARHGVGVSDGCIRQTHIDDEIHPVFIYSSQGYSDLTNAQLYALIKTIQRDFECLRLDVDTDNKLKEIIEKQKNACGFLPIEFYLTESYFNTRKNSEIKKLKAQKSPYKSAF